jgi:phosphoribosylanthranilate isomerase
MGDMPPRVKICGLTRVEDAALAVDLGAWALGMIFAPGSPRRCRIGDAEAIAGALRGRAELAGVFVNAPLDELVRLHERVRFTLLQLHGDEGPSYCSAAARRTGARIIKAANVADRGDVQALDAFREVDFHLVDARVAGMRGGTGQTVDAELVRSRRSDLPLILAGGLTDENVAAAATAVQPFAVDTASGTEAEPGVKDHERLRAFFEAVETVRDPVEAA